MLPLWTIRDGENGNYKPTHRTALKGVYGKYSDYIVDGFRLVPHNAKYFADDVHPNDDGFAFYGENLAKELENILAKSEE